MTQTLLRRAKRLEMRASLPTMSAIGSQSRPSLASIRWQSWAISGLLSTKGILVPPIVR